MHEVNVLVQLCTCERAAECHLVHKLRLMHELKADAQLSTAEKERLFWLSTGDVICRRV